MLQLRFVQLLYDLDSEAQNQSVIQAVTTGAKSLEEAQREQYALRFLKMGRALHAFHWAGVTGKGRPFSLKKEVSCRGIYRAFRPVCWSSGILTFPTNTSPL